MNISTKVRDYIAQNFQFGKAEQLAEDESLLDRGVIDSTGAMELVTFIEAEFRVAVNDQDLVPENLDSIGAITAFISRKLEEEKPAGLRAAAA